MKTENTQKRLRLWKSISVKLTERRRKKWLVIVSLQLNRHAYGNSTTCNSMWMKFLFIKLFLLRHISAWRFFLLSLFFSLNNKTKWKENQHKKCKEITFRFALCSSGFAFWTSWRRYNFRHAHYVVNVHDGQCRDVCNFLWTKKRKSLSEIRYITSPIPTRFCRFKINCRKLSRNSMT